MIKILLVEDTESLGETLSLQLKKEGYLPTWSKCVAETEEILKREDFDLFILDIGLPDGSGLDIAKNLLTEREVPIIFLTALDGAEDRLRGFEIGAADYIPKPFHRKELLLRVKKLLNDRGVKSTYKFQGYLLDFEAMTLLTPTGELHQLPTKDYRLLTHLIKESPNVVSRDEILNTLWGEENFPSNRTIDNAIVRLRKLFGNEEFILSIRGIGYKWSLKEE
jgi:DNA-binding response OmpR family regulator